MRLWTSPARPWVGMALLVLIGIGLWVLGSGQHHPTDELRPAVSPLASTPDTVRRGAYLASVGNCAACHTQRGGSPYTGGVGIPTPFGVVYAGNLTPDPDHGLGRWTVADFRRALHEGISRDGRALYPAFPYNNTTLLSRDDVDAIFAYLQSLPAVPQATPAHDLRFPYNTAWSLAIWRALYFRPARFEPTSTQTAEWNRGAYLVKGLGHCNACHAGRNALGAVQSTAGEGGDLGGGMMAQQGWYAPSLTDASQGGLANWTLAQITQLLKSGVSDQGSALGPMAEVVFRSLQHWSDADIQATAVYLKSLPALAAANVPASQAVRADLEWGSRIYRKQCADCHGEQGQGARVQGHANQWAYPPLAGNRAVTMNPPHNLIRMVRSGGFAPATQGNPQPFGMPPFDLRPEEMAAVISYIRQSWGNQAGAISAAQVQTSD